MDDWVKNFLKSLLISSVDDAACWFYLLTHLSKSLLTHVSKHESHIGFYLLHLRMIYDRFFYDPTYIGL